MILQEENNDMSDGGHHLAHHQRMSKNEPQKSSVLKSEDTSELKLIHMAASLGLTRYDI